MTAKETMDKVYDVVEDWNEQTLNPVDAILAIQSLFEQWTEA